MKMVIAVVQDYDCDRLLTALSGSDIRATRLTSMGGFLRTGNTTILMGMNDAMVPAALEVLRATCQSRTISALSAAADAVTDVFAGEVADVNIGGAVVFVTPVARFEQFART
ncbi:MAG: cyclic-di-AMP receptor [Thermomicrobiales bacterium]